MKTISAATFKAQCLTLMDDVRSTKRPLIITKRGKPVAKLVPIEEPKDDFIGRLKGVFEVVGDLDSDPQEKWESTF
jgi:prevent-host-death family protein